MSQRRARRSVKGKRRVGQENSASKQTWPRRVMTQQEGGLEAKAGPPRGPASKRQKSQRKTVGTGPGGKTINVQSGTEVAMTKQRREQERTSASPVGQIGANRGK